MLEYLETAIRQLDQQAYIEYEKLAGYPGQTAMSELEKAESRAIYSACELAGDALRHVDVLLQAAIFPIPDAAPETKEKT